MLNTLLFAILMSLEPPSAPPSEPDQSRPIGIVPPFKAEPTPPDWLRTESHAIAFVDCQHYIYEAYAGPDGTWLVRYVMLPEGNEAFREIEQAFLFGPKPGKKPQELKPSDILYEAQGATWKGKSFKLVDRRDLMRPS